MLDYRQQSAPHLSAGTSTMHLKAHIPATFHFEERIAAARPRLTRITRALGIPADVADDLVQDTLLAAWRQLDQLRAYKNFDAWLDAICRNNCRMFLRTYGTPTTGKGPIVLSLDAALHDGDTTEVDPPDAQALDPIEELDRQDLSQLLDHALGQLSTPARQVLELRYLQELPEDEAATRIGVSVGALEARLHRARRQLRGVLSGPMRTEAEAFGLVPHDDPDASSWQETRIWCNLCGRRRLLGNFSQHVDGSVYMCMRCPDCSARYGFDIYGNKGLAPLKEMHSFRPAISRVMRALSEGIIAQLPLATGKCPTCHQMVSVRTLWSETVGKKQASANVPIRCWIAHDCPRCGVHGVHSAVEPVVWFHPMAQRFMREHPRWITAPESIVEYAGRPTVRFHLVDAVSAAQLTVLADPVTLRLLAAFEE
ncbi:MAG TPA: RNA polymerase sigma factor [Ktedonobacterales bacterium]|nr:RNA polymerase sigma factor [Ktedonobacterales bacterium]